MLPLFGFTCTVVLFSSVLFIHVSYQACYPCCTFSLRTPKGCRWNACHRCRKAIIRESPSPFIRSSSAILSWLFLPLKKYLQISLLSICSVPLTDLYMTDSCWTMDIKEEECQHQRENSSLHYCLWSTWAWLSYLVSSAFSVKGSG